MRPHLSNDKAEYGTPTPWIPTATNVNHLIREWSERTDLFTMLTPSTLPGGVVAMFTPSQAEVHINIAGAFGESADPESIPDLKVRANQFDYAAPLGAAFHEAMHARFSTWSLDDANKLDRKVRDALVLLEESRIEAQGLIARPKMKAFMRLFVNKLIMGEIDEKMMERMTRVGQAAHSCGIVLARVDAGVLKKKDAKLTKKIIKKTLGEDVLNELSLIWKKFQTINSEDPTSYQQMVVLAEKWVAAVAKAGEAEKPEPQKNEDGTPGDPEPLTDEEIEFLKELIGGMAEDLEEAEIEAHGDIAEQEQTEADEAELDKRREEQEEQKNHEEAAKRVFKPNSETTVGGRSKMELRRDATPDEHAAAVTVGKQLDKAKYRDRIKTVGTSRTPPGRLRMRQVIAGRAAHEAGAPDTYEPWRKVTRHTTEDPNLILGMMVDVSGSMGGAMKPMGVAAWVISEAIRRIQGTAAMVYYGNSVRPALAPGEHLEQVQIHGAHDGTEAFDEGFKALDGSINLLHGRGARLLVNVSDGNYYGAGQTAACEKWLARCKQAGVAVLWLGYGDADEAERLCAEHGAQFVRPTGNIVDDALMIGRAGEQALSRIGARN